jgi:WD40 repeat protein
MWIRRVAASVTALAYAPDGRTLYTVEGGRVSAWDIASRQPTRLARLDALDASNACALCVVGHGRYLVLDAWYHCRAWDLQEMKPLPEVDVTRWFPPSAPGDTAVRFISPSGQLVHSRDVLTGRTATLVRKPRGMSTLRLFAFTPDDRKVALVDDEYRAALVTVGSGKSVALSPPRNAWVHYIQFSPDGSALVWVFSNTMYVTATADLRGPGVPIPWRPGVLALHPTAPILVALDTEYRPALFGLRTGEVIRSFDLDLGSRVRRVAFSPAGLTCAVAGTTRFAVFDVDL